MVWSAWICKQRRQQQQQQINCKVFGSGKHVDACTRWKMVFPFLYRRTQRVFGPIDQTFIFSERKWKWGLLLNLVPWPSHSHFLSERSFSYLVPGPPQSLATRRPPETHLHHRWGLHPRLQSARFKMIDYATRREKKIDFLQDQFPQNLSQNRNASHCCTKMDICEDFF